MHNNESSRSGKKVTHFCESDLVASEDEDIQDDVLSQHTLDEGIVVFLGISKVGNVLSFAQLLWRTHLLFKIGSNSHSWTSRARIANQVYNPSGQGGNFSH